MSSSVRPRKVIYYADSEGREPFVDWLEGLAPGFQDRIFKRLQRVQLGNLGDHKHVGSGILELRLHFGKGYRIYFGQDGLGTVVLLCAGAKHTQNRDIEKARMNWEEYLTNQIDENGT